MGQAKVMIVEDEVIVAEDLRRNLHACGYDVPGYAVDGQEAVSMALRIMPDLILMDVFLDGTFNGIAAARTISQAIDASIIFVTGHSADSVVDEAVRSGADGYIVKPFQLGQVTSAIKLALHRRRHDVQRKSQSRIPSGDIGRDEPFAAITQRLHALLTDDSVWVDLADKADGGPREQCVTPREREIIRGLVCYRRVSTVADALGISVHTARNHLKSIFRKLNLHSQDELLRFLLEGESV
jgi:DNA-binding NarL/FixJ family response regulator